MRNFILSILLSMYGTMAMGGIDRHKVIDFFGFGGWKEMEQSPRAWGELKFHYTSWNWASEGYKSYSSPFSLTLEITTGRDMERFCEEFNWLSDTQSCPPTLSVSGMIQFSDSHKPLEGGGIWRDGDLVGWLSCAKDDSSCTLNFKGREYGAEDSHHGDAPWFKVKITYNADRIIRFVSGTVSPVWGADEYYLVWHSEKDD